MAERQPATGILPDPGDPSYPTKSVFVGHTVNDIYLRNGKHLGPGTVTLPYGTDEEVAAFNDFVKSVRRTQAKRPPELRVNLDAINTPPPKQLSQATAEELYTALAALGQPIPESIASVANEPASQPPMASDPAPGPTSVQQFTPIVTQPVQPTATPSSIQNAPPQSTAPPVAPVAPVAVPPAAK